MLSSGIGRDPTAPDYRFHDDPDLIPYSSNQKREYSNAKEGGRLAARYVFDKHADLFQGNQIEMHPPIKAFMPKTLFRKENASEEMLKVYLEGFDVERASKVYEAMVAKGDPVSNESKQSLLEMLAYFEHEPAPDEHIVEASRFQDEPKKGSNAWETGCLADKIYSSMSPPTPEARAAMLCGLAKARSYNRTNEAYQECRANKVRLSAAAYNAAIIMKGGREAERNWRNVQLALKDMKASGVRPNAGTFLALLSVLQRISKRQPEFAQPLVFSTIAEAKRCGIEFCLGHWDLLLKAFPGNAQVLRSVLSEVEHKGWNEVKSLFDSDFFPTAMSNAFKADDLELAYRVHEMVMRGGNDIHISEYAKYNMYYTAFGNLVVKNEPLDVAMEFMEKFTPHVYSPSIVFYRMLIRKIEEEAGYQHLPRLWVDLQATRFTGLKMESLLEEAVSLMEIINKAPLADLGLTNLVPSLLQIFRDCFETLRTARLPLHKNQQATPTCDNVLRFALAHGDNALAFRTMGFCRDNAAEMMGSLNEETIAPFAVKAVEEGDKSAAINALVYAMEHSFDCADSIAKDIAENFVLETDEKKSLNKMFAHETRWKTLV